MYEENNHLNNGDLNPEVQNELESLNTSSSQINDLENELQELRNNHRENLSKWTTQLSEMQSKIKKSIINVRPYYDLKFEQSQIQRNVQTATIKLEHASKVLIDSEAMLAKTEANMKLDNGSMELLNRANQHINEAKKDCTEANNELEKYLNQYKELESQITKLKRRYPNDIKKAKDYFDYTKEMKDQQNEEKLKIHMQEEKVNHWKSRYNDSLIKLEEISNRIHQQRQKIKEETLGPRGEAVGAEIVESLPLSESTPIIKRNSINETIGCSPLNIQLPKSVQHHRTSKINRRASATYNNTNSTPLVDSLLHEATKYRIINHQKIPSKVVIAGRDGDKPRVNNLIIK